MNSFLNQERKKTRDSYRPRSGILSREIIFVQEDSSLHEAARVMRENHIGDVIVVKRGSDKRIPVGILTDRDIAIETFGQGINGDNLLVKDIMSPLIATGRNTDDVFTLVRIMKDAGVGRLPLLDQSGQLVGLITAKRLTRILLEGLNDLFEMSELRKKAEIEGRAAAN